MEEGRLSDVVLRCERAESQDNVKDGSEGVLRRTACADSKEMCESFCVFFTFEAVHAGAQSSVLPVRNY